MTQDTAAGLNQGNASEPPAEFRERYYNFRSKLGRATKATPKKPPLNR